VLLKQLPSGTVNFQTFDDLFGWVLTVACYKLRDQIDREHLDRRKGLDVEAPDRGGLVESASNEAAALLESVRVQLNQEQRIVFDGRMGGHSLSRIAQDNGWSAERARCLMNQIRLLAREVHQDEPV
jgi:DNA-directed RNA polymerase specialized sigma24 family protein